MSNVEKPRDFLEVRFAHKHNRGSSREGDECGSRRGARGREQPAVFLSLLTLSHFPALWWGD